MFDFSWNMLRYFPASVSTYSDAHDSLFTFVYYLSVIIFVLVNSLLVFFVWRYRHKPGAKAYHYHGNNVVEFTWTLLPTILFAGLGLYSDEMWKVMKYPSRIPTANIEIDVAAQAFAWHARYPGADGILGKRSATYRTKTNIFGVDPSDEHGKDDIIITGEFNLPINKNVVVHLSSVDVLHSFFLPHFRIKQDAVPGSWIDLWFNGRKAGVFELACAELCGSGHYGMRGVVNMQSEVDFNKWMMTKIEAKKQALAAAPPAAPAPAAAAAPPAQNEAHH